MGVYTMSNRRKSGEEKSVKALWEQIRRERERAEELDARRQAQAERQVEIMDRLLAEKDNALATNVGLRSVIVTLLRELTEQGEDSFAHEDGTFRVVAPFSLEFEQYKRLQMEETESGLMVWLGDINKEEGTA